jgi:hypothetical protein
MPSWVGPGRVAHRDDLHHPADEVGLKARQRLSSGDFGEVHCCGLRCDATLRMEPAKWGLL